MKINKPNWENLLGLRQFFTFQIEKALNEWFDKEIAPYEFFKRGDAYNE